MGVALPELPDDRRARPQRITPAGPPASRHAVRTPPEGRPVVPPVDAAGPVPGGLGAVPYRPQGIDQGPVRNGAGPNGSPPNGGYPNGGYPNGGQPPQGSHGPHGGRPHGSGGYGVTPPRTAAGEPPRIAGGRPPGRPVGGVPNGPRGNGARPLPGTSRPIGPVVPPQRGSARFDDDEPTEVYGALAPDAASTDAGPTDAGPDDAADTAPTGPPAGAPAGPVEIPGRHRRRAGASPGSRPASEYKAQADAARAGKKVRPGRRRRENFWRELPLLIVVALLMTFLIQTFLAKVYVIPSGSMETTLHGCTGCNNDRVLVDKVVYEFTDPSPGDVVVFRGPDSWTNSDFSVPEPTNPLVNGLQQFGSLIGLAPPDEKDFVKRVIAVGGQTVQCCDSRNRVLVDGEPLEEPYIHYVPQSGPRQSPFDAVTVPEGELWLMGDSRNNSADSRALGHGPVPVANVIGQARLIVLPFPRFGWIPSINPQASEAVGMAASDTGAPLEPVAAAGAPLALGLLGTLPIAIWRRRPSGRDELFLP